MPQPILVNTLHAILCAPAGAPRTGVLLVPPLFEEKRCAHRAMTACALALANAGAVVLHPDLTATGNSDGVLAETTVEQWEADIRACADYLSAQAHVPLTLIAVRAGALLALRAAEQFGQCILCQPLLSGKSYLRQLRTRRMIQDSVTGDAPPTVGPFEVEGHALSPTLYAQIEELSLNGDAPSGEVCLLQCSFNDKVLLEYAKLSERWGLAHPVRCLTLEPFWNPHTPGDYAELTRALVEEVLP